MNQKVGRNDPCTCGSGKKFKNCCLKNQQPRQPKKLTAKWLNAPQGPNLIKHVFGEAVEGSGKPFQPLPPQEEKD